jgi:hypothetical protein
MRGSMLAVVAISMPLLLNGCVLYRQGAPSEQQFRRGLTTHPYIAPPGRGEAIISGAREVQICTRRAEVLRLMGEPDFGVRTHDSTGDRSAVEWHYVIRESSQAPSDPGQAVTVTLNAGHEVIGLQAMGVLEQRVMTVMDDPGCTRA